MEDLLTFAIGDGDDGEPVRSPSGRLSFHRPISLRWRVSVE